MLTIKSLSKAFDQQIILDKLDIHFNDQTLTAIIGPNGCGKSTLFNLITGQLPADSGHIFFNEKDMTCLNAKQIAQQGILRKFQVPGVYPSMTVKEHFQLSYAVKNQPIDSKKLLDTAQQMQLFHLLDSPAKLLSSGQKQWLELAMLLLLSPKLLLLDEPIAGMTQDEIEKTLIILKQLHQKGMSIICIEHNIHFVRQLTEDIAVIFEGKLAIRDNFENIQKNATIKKHYLGNLYV